MDILLDKNQPQQCYNAHCTLHMHLRYVVRLCSVLYCFVTCAPSIVCSLSHSPSWTCIYARKLCCMYLISTHSIKKMACYTFRLTCFPTVRSNLIWCAVGGPRMRSVHISHIERMLFAQPSSHAIVWRTIVQGTILCASKSYLNRSGKVPCSHCSKSKLRAIIQCKQCSIYKWFTYLENFMQVQKSQLTFVLHPHSVRTHFKSVSVRPNMEAYTIFFVPYHCDVYTQ